MVINKLYNSVDVLSKALDAAWLRNEVLTENIANVDTPNYKRKEVTFESELKSAIDNSAFIGKKTNSRHLDIGSSSAFDVNAKVVVPRNTQMRTDGNNVDMDSEMAELAKNTIMYNALVQKISREFARLRTIINEGRK